MSRALTAVTSPDPSVYRGPMTASDADPVRTFMPWVDEPERALRLRLLKARNIAPSRALGSHGRGQSLFWLVNQIAGDWWCAPAGKDDLKDMADALVRLFMVASTLERLEAPESNLPEGGAE